MFTLPGGGIVIDTPGMRELGLDGADIVSAFADIVDLAAGCLLIDCAHERETGCAILQAVAEGRREEAYLNSWHKLRQESRYAGVIWRQIEEEKLTMMFAAVGGKKNARRLMRQTGNGGFDDEYIDSPGRK